jgi:hypothetical protein
LGHSTENEIACDLPVVQSPAIDTSLPGGEVQVLDVVTSGIDPRLDFHLIRILRMIKAGELAIFVSPSFKKHHPKSA